MQDISERDGLLDSLAATAKETVLASQCQRRQTCRPPAEEALSKRQR
jgi:hypothetical protein